MPHYSLDGALQLKATADEWWTFGSTLLGAVVGSAVGGFISFILASRSSKEILKRDQIARREKDAAIAFQLLVKTGKILSSFAAVHHQIEAMIKDAEDKGIKGELWTKMLPLVGTSKRVHFEVNELAILVPLKANDIFNELMILDDKHNGLLSTIELYSNKRSEFGSLFGGEVKDDGVGSTPFTAEQFLKAAPRMAELNALALSIRSGGKEYFEVAQKTFHDLSSILQKNFSDLKFPLFKVVDYNLAKTEANIS